MECGVSSNPSHTSEHGSEPALIYGIDSLVIVNISALEFRDYRGDVWTSDDS
jgi:hypothetical protein